MAVLLHVLGTSLSLLSRGGVLTSATGPTTTSFLVRFFFRRLFILALPEVLIDTVIAFGVADLVLVGTVGEEEKEKEEEKKEEIRSAVLHFSPLFSFFLLFLKLIIVEIYRCWCSYGCGCGCGCYLSHLILA